MEVKKKKLKCRDLFCDISKTTLPSPPYPNKVEFEHRGLKSFCWSHHCWEVGEWLWWWWWGGGGEGVGEGNAG